MNVAIEGNPWGHGAPGPWDSKGYAAIPFGPGGEGGWVTPPVDNSADLLDRRLLLIQVAAYYVLLRSFVG